MTTVERSTIDAVGETALPGARWTELFFTGVSGLVVIWLPLDVIEQIDGLRAFLTWREIAGDLALLIVLLAAAVAVASGLLSIATSGWCGVRARGAIAWGCVVLPVGVICAWQFASDAKHWFERVSGHRLTVGPEGRASLLVAIFALVGWLCWRVGTIRLLRLVTETLRSTRLLVITALALSVGFLLLHPPVVALSQHSHIRPPVNHFHGAAQPPDIYLISLDALADVDANVCGTGPTLMPRLRQLAATSGCFARTYASSNFTTPTSATLETGVLPWTHWATQIDARVISPFRSQSLGAVLSAAGYSTYSVSANTLASPRHHGTYSDYGMEIIVPSDSLRMRAREAFTLLPDSSLPFFLYPVFSFLGTADVYLNSTHYPYDPERVYGTARSLVGTADRGRPMFIWMHSLPPHAPYLPPQSTRYRLLPPGQLDTWRELLPEDSHYSPGQQQLVDRNRDRYRECILGADEALGGMLDYLSRTRRLDAALVIVTADHGESFEKSYLGHAGDLLHEALLRIPLVIKAPGQRVGRVVQTPVSQADIAPTIFEVAHANPPAYLEGRSLTPALHEQSLEPRPVISMALERTSRFTALHTGHFAVIDGSYKLVYHLGADRSELYELASDPSESHDVAARYPEIAARLRQFLKARLHRAELGRQRAVGG